MKLMYLLALVVTVTELRAQNDSIYEEKMLQEVIFSVNKWAQPANRVSNKITKITPMEIARNNPQTAADMLGQTGTVFIQKSQLGGGSPMIRGFATNRVLMAIDGIRMNNAIYRSGNLQNIISIDPFTLENAEVIFGPGSLIYGSDAIGGVMDFRTLEPKLSEDGKLRTSGTVVGRYASANNENTGHAHLNMGWSKWSVLTSVSYSSFDDLRMGKHGGHDSYLRHEYVERRNGNDEIVQNADPRLQRFSGYDQLNLLQKLRFRPSKWLDLQYSFTYAGTGTSPRYDRLINYRSGQLRFAEWDYGPMLWRMHTFQATLSKPSALYTTARLTAGYQNYEESRIDRARGNDNRQYQAETVDAFNLNWDATRELGKGTLYYGLEHVYNKVGSFGQRTNISTGTVSPLASRYPDGSTWSTSAVYGSYQVELDSKLLLTTGLRYSYNTLDANFDTTLIRFPYQRASLRDGGVTGNVGLVYYLGNNWQLNSNVSTGYRMPNVDDIGKLFESVPGILTVPNPGLNAEYAWNFEAGIARKLDNRFLFELNGFYTLLNNAIVRRPFTFNGQDSLEFNGIRSGVEALQNVSRASVWGLQISAEYFLTSRLSLLTHLNWISGRETDDLKDEQVPLRHAAPFYGSTFARYRVKRFFLEASAFYNSSIPFDELAPVERVKLDIYARDANGNPYSPGWYTLNLRGSYNITEKVMLNLGWENVTNQRYRPYSSGIVAAGSNLVVSLKVTF